MPNTIWIVPEWFYHLFNRTSYPCVFDLFWRIAFLAMITTVELSTWIGVGLCGYTEHWWAWFHTLLYCWFYYLYHKFTNGQKYSLVSGIKLFASVGMDIHSVIKFMPLALILNLHTKSHCASLWVSNVTPLALYLISASGFIANSLRIFVTSFTASWDACWELGEVLCQLRWHNKNDTQILCTIFFSKIGGRKCPVDISIASIEHIKLVKHHEDNILGLLIVYDEIYEEPCGLSRSFIGHISVIDNPTIKTCQCASLPPCRLW